MWNSEKCNKKSNSCFDNEMLLKNDVKITMEQVFLFLFIYHTTMIFNYFLSRFVPVDQKCLIRRLGEKWIMIGIFHFPTSTLISKMVCFIVEPIEQYIYMYDNIKWFLMLCEARQISKQMLKHRAITLLK